MRSCALCDQPIVDGSGYCVRIEVYADPHLPPMSIGEVESADFNATLADLTKQMQNMSADDLQDGVHRRFEYRLCPICQKRYLANPLGMPRTVRASAN